MKAIICLGDSITFGIGETPALGWVGRLKKYFEPSGRYHHVVNLGFPGHDTNDLLKRIDSELKTRVRIKRDTDEFLTIVSIGTNDSRFNDSKSAINPRITKVKFEENIQKIIQKISKYQTKIIFLTTPPANEELTSPFEGDYFFTNKQIGSFNNITKKVCKNNKIPVIDIFNLMRKLNYQNLLEDGLHPNSKGYEFIFKHVRKFLKDNKTI